MNKDSLFHDFTKALNKINVISNCPEKYMAGVILKDSETLHFIETLDCIQAIIMQSIQVNNLKRANRYILVSNMFIKRNVSLADRLRSDITNLLIENQNHLDTER